MISYIIPYYNGSKFIESAMLSILEERSELLELIVIDDCSNSNELLFIENFLKVLNDKRVRLIKNKDNLGLMQSLNKATLQTKNEFISILGQDDMVSDKHFKVMCKEFVQSPSGVLFFCDAFIVNGTDITSDLLRGNKIPKNISIDNYSDYKKLWRWNFVVSTGICMNKNLFLQSGGFKTPHRNYGEWLVWLRCLSKGSLVHVDSVYSFYRRHSSNITNSMFGKNYFSTFKYNFIVNNFGWSNSEKGLNEISIYMVNNFKQLLMLLYKTFIPVRLSSIKLKIKKREVDL